MIHLETTRCSSHWTESRDDNRPVGQRGHRPFLDRDCLSALLRAVQGVAIRFHHVPMVSANDDGLRAA